MLFPRYTGPRFRVNVDHKDSKHLCDLFFEAIRQNNKPERYFRRAGLIVRVDQLPDGSARATPLDIDGMAHAISEYTETYGFDRSGHEVSKLPPPLIARLMCHHPTPPFPELVQSVYRPVYVKDGRLIWQEGFDRATGILCVRPEGWCFKEIVERIGSARLPWALEQLTDILYDFPFKSQSDRANAFSLMVLPVVRHMIHGPTPLHLIMKSRSGEGASLLAENVLYLSLGSTTFVPAPGDDSEWGRTLFALLSQNPQAVVFDNVTRLASPALACAITAPAIAGRRVRTSTAAPAVVHCVFVATGIDVLLSPELARRTVFITLDSGLEHPERRTDFRIPSLSKWVREHHLTLFEALLTLVQHWFDEGAPRSTKVMGGFEEYAAVMGGILECAGIEGFLSNVSARPDVVVGSGEDGWEKFIAEWLMAFGLEPVTTKELVSIARQVELLPPSGTTTKLGQLIGSRVGQVTSGFAVEQATKRNGNNRWRIVERGSQS